jgi:hypothetical protein
VAIAFHPVIDHFALEFLNAHVGGPLFCERSWETGQVVPVPINIRLSSRGTMKATLAEIPQSAGLRQLLNC